MSCENFIEEYLDKYIYKLEKKQGGGSFANYRYGWSDEKNHEMYFLIDELKTARERFLKICKESPLTN